jgi:DNA-binding beta-propeller fold protein YncE
MANEERPGERDEMWPSSAILQLFMFSWAIPMRGGYMRQAMLKAITFMIFAAIGSAWQAPSSMPYRVLKSARVGGEGGWDYIYADTDGRRLYIPRGATREVPATDGKAAVPPIGARLTIFNLDTLESAGEIPGVGGNGTAVDSKTGHGFTSDHPQVSMFDTKTNTLIKHVDVGAARPDGIVFDSFNQRVYVFSHPTKDATVIDSKDGTVLGTIDLGGVPEQGVPDGKGMLYVVMQDAVGSVTAVDVKTMKAIGHYSFLDAGGCNGLALDAKNNVLFAACGRSGNPPAQPSQPTMVILSATDGKILAKLPLAGGSDGAAFNPVTMEAFSTHGNGTMTIVKEKSPTSFEVEQNLQTMNGARTITFDSKTGHLFTMSQERGPAPPPPPGGGRGGQGAAVPGSFAILMIGR